MAKLNSGVRVKETGGKPEWVRTVRISNSELKQSKHACYLFLQKLFRFFLSLVNYLELFVHQFPRHLDPFLDNSFLYFWILQKGQSHCW